MFVFCAFQLYRASTLFETIRHETQHSTDYKLSLFDLQTSSYQALQRVLVSLGELIVLSSPVVLLFCSTKSLSLALFVRCSHLSSLIFTLSLCACSQCTNYHLTSRFCPPESSAPAAFIPNLSPVLLLVFLLLSGRHDEALAIAERGRTRAFADLLVERQQGNQQAASTDPYIPVTVEHILETVNGQRAMVLYYSLAGGFLYSWLISPGTGTHLNTLKHT